MPEQVEMCCIDLILVQYFFLNPNRGLLKPFGTHPVGLGVGLKREGRVKVVNNQQG